MRAEALRGRWRSARDPERRAFTAREILNQSWSAMKTAADTDRVPGLTPEVATGWLLAMFAAPATGKQFQTLRYTLTPGWLTNEEPDRATEERNGWLALGALGPFAYAAGLTLTEARSAHAAGTLEVERLRVLAGLRGWVFPALP